MTLSELSNGDVARITGYAAGNRQYRSKLLVMGFTRGSIITHGGCAPMGDPIQVNIRGSSIVLRKAEASVVEVELLKGE